MYRSVFKNSIQNVMLGGPCTLEIAHMQVSDHLLLETFHLYKYNNSLEVQL